MPTDLDIYRSAKLLIDQHGQDALLEAALRANVNNAKGARTASDRGRGSRGRGSGI